MLLPSALQCDPPRVPTTRLQAALVASPPASPPSLSTQTAFGNIISTCRSLQALIATPEARSPEPATTQQLTPPISHAEPPPLKFRLRSRARAEESSEHVMPRKRIVKRQPPRGANKRRRGLDDDMGRDNDEESEAEGSGEAEEKEAPQTPKRARIAPETMPLGLARGDYHDLHLRERDSQQGLGISVERSEETTGGVSEEWTAEDDRILVELVLEKLKLTKSDWQDCARSLGKDKHGVGRRWKSLMINGEVGLKTRSSRRAKLHSTWR